MSNSFKYNPEQDLNRTSTSNPDIEQNYVYENAKDLNVAVDLGNAIPLECTTTWVCPVCGQLNSTIKTILCSSCGHSLVSSYTRSVTE